MHRMLAVKIGTSSSLALPQPALVVAVPAAHGLHAERLAHHLAVLLPQPHIGRLRQVRLAWRATPAHALHSAWVPVT